MYRYIFLNSGYGVYNYDNKFYKYEGQWRNGLKHGMLHLHLVCYTDT